MTYFGAHMPNADIIGAMEEIRELGGNFMQIFVSSPRGQISHTTVERYETKAYNIRNYMKNNDFKLVIHSPYTLNFANPKEVGFKVIQDDLQVAHMLGAIGCVIHVGKQTKMEYEIAYNNMKESITRIIDFIITNNLKSKLILETASGQGSEMFTDIDLFINFYKSFSSQQRRHFKLCVDTCHIHAAGVPLENKNDVKLLFNKLKERDVLKHVVVIHFNNSKTEANSHKDRHAPITDGHIPIDSLKNVLKCAVKFKIPFVLETPSDSYKQEIPWINKYIKDKNL
jgi:deoxyribonuclease-4